MGVFASDPGDEGFELVFFGGCWAFEGSAGAAVGAAVAFGSGAGGAVAFGGVVAYQAFGVFGLTWFRLACGANLWGWLSCGGWVVGVLGTHFSAYNPSYGLSALFLFCFLTPRGAGNMQRKSPEAPDPGTAPLGACQGTGRG